jgi:hypothetical protein
VDAGGRRLIDESFLHDQDVREIVDRAKAADIS